MKIRNLIIWNKRKQSPALTVMIFIALLSMAKITF
ncbi:MAG: hypothetical protein ACI909_002940, partial [Planctomycetota bacterium]